jgi:hypothetical protein
MQCDDRAARTRLLPLPGTALPHQGESMGRMTPLIDPRTALSDPQLLGSALPPTAQPMKVLILAALGASLTEPERRIFQQFTNRSKEPGQPVKIFCAVKGRRAGFSSAMGSVVIPYTAGLCQHNLRRGEVGYLLVCAQDQRTADQILDYAEEAFRASPILSQLIASRVQHELRLTNNIVITVRAADSKRLRGLTLVDFIADEQGHWPTDELGANPDAEVLAAVKPGLLTTNGRMWIGSTPYARRGELWRLYQKHYGPQGDPLTLVCKGTSLEFNSTIPVAEIERALAEDEAKNRAEYLAEFRTDVESFVSIDAVTNGCLIRGLYEKPPQRGVQYAAFVDPSGGSADSMTLAIGSFDHGRQLVLVDAIREVVPPFNPSSVVEEFVRVLGSYGLDHLVGDRYAGMWPVEAFAKFNVRYEQSARPKSDLYLDLLPLLNSGRIHLLDHAKLLNQLCSLERRTARGGRDSIDHPPSGHDDLANCVAGLASILTQQPSINYAAWSDTVDSDPHGIESWRRLRQQAYLQSHGQIVLP